jgi:hypothetical protein
VGSKTGRRRIEEKTVTDFEKPLKAVREGMENNLTCQAPPEVL